MMKQSASSQQWKPKMKILSINQNIANSQPLNSHFQHQSSLPNLSQQPSTLKNDEKTKQEQFCESFKLLLQDYKSGQLSIFQKQNRQFKELLLYIKQFQLEQAKLIASDQMNQFINLIGVPLSLKQAISQKLERSKKLADGNVIRAYQTSHQVFFKLFKYLLAYGSKMAKIQLPILDELIQNYDDLDLYQQTKEKLVQGVMLNRKASSSIKSQENLQDQMLQKLGSDRYNQLCHWYQSQIKQIEQYNQFAVAQEKSSVQFKKYYNLA